MLSARQNRGVEDIILVAERLEASAGDAVASLTPRGVRSGSFQPVNRLSRSCPDWPWRTSNQNAAHGLFSS